MQRQDGGSTAVGGIGAGSRTAALPWEMTVMSSELRVSDRLVRHVTQGPLAHFRAMMYRQAFQGALDQPLVGVFRGTMRRRATWDCDHNPKRYEQVSRQRAGRHSSIRP